MCGVVVRFFFQAEDGIRDLVRSRGLGDVYKRQMQQKGESLRQAVKDYHAKADGQCHIDVSFHLIISCLLYTCDAADERSSVDLGGRRIIKKKTQQIRHGYPEIA